MQKITIAIFIVLLCLILGVVFFGWPKYKDFNNLRFDIKIKNIDLENKRNYFSHLNIISTALKEHDVELSKINSALPTEPIVPELVNFLAEKSSQNGLILEKVDLKKIAPIDKNSKIQKISLEFSITGFYSAFRNFISSLQKSAKLIEVNSITFAKSDKGDVLSFNLGIETYSY